MHRPTIGIIALVLLLGAGGFWLWDDPSLYVWFSAFVRIGALMSALWLAFPQVSRAPMWLFVVLGLVLAPLVLIKNPRMLILVLVVAVVVLKLRPWTSPPRAR